MATWIDQRFLLGEVAGEGAMGTVYRAEDHLTGRVVAVKIFRGVFGDEAVERFRREVRVLEDLSHPHIVAMIADGTTLDGRPYYVMEWLEGTTLRGYVQRWGPLSVDEAIAVGLQLAEALGAAHERGIIHRDLKPSNVMAVDGRLDRVALVDFGIARDEQAATLTGSEAILGTPGYISPEQARASRDVDIRTDIFSFGVLLFEMLTGRIPYDATSRIERLMAPLQQRPLTLDAVRSDAPPALVDLLAAMLEPDPEHRPPSAVAVADGLRHVQGRGAMIAQNHTSSTFAPTERRHRARRWMAVVLAALLIVVGGAFAWWTLEAPSSARAEKRKKKRKPDDSPKPPAFCTVGTCEPLPEALAATPSVEPLLQHVVDHVHRSDPEAHLTSVLVTAVKSSVLDFDDVSSSIIAVAESKTKSWTVTVRQRWMRTEKPGPPSPEATAFGVPSGCPSDQAIAAAGGHAEKAHTLLLRAGGAIETATGKAIANRGVVWTIASLPSRPTVEATNCTVVQ